MRDLVVVTATALKALIWALALIAKSFVWVLAITAFLLWAGVFALGGDIYYLYQTYGEPVTNEMIDALLPKALAISVVFWLALLVAYRRWLT